jgi:hypothetical protein
MELCELFGCTLKELRTRMSSDEYPLWMVHLKERGLHSQRLEGILACGFAGVCNSNGAKVKPTLFLPKSEQRKILSFKEGRSLLKAWFPQRKKLNAK